MRSEKDEPIAVVEEPGRITNLEHSDEAMIGQADRFRAADQVEDWEDNRPSRDTVAARRCRQGHRVSRRSLVREWPLADQREVPSTVSWA